MKKSIALDMDEVIADVLPKFLDLFEERYGERLSKEKYWGRKIYTIKGSREIREALFVKGFFRDLLPIPGSIEGVKQLMEHYNVYITTAAMEFRSSFEDKYDWLAEYFPFIHWKNIIFLGDKSIIGADYMVDDNAFNLETFRGKGILFTAYHNVDEMRFPRVNNWGELLDFFKKERIESSLVK